MRVTRTQVLTLVVAIAGLSAPLIAGLFRNPAPVEGSTPVKREPAPVLHDQDAEVRLAAIDALSDLESETAVHALASLLSDQDLTIRRHAVSALGDIGGENAVMYLGQARYDPKASVRVYAYHILSELEYDAAD